VREKEVLKPYPFQVADLAKLKKHGYTALLNMGTGSGKTAESLFSHIESGSSRTLIVAPEQTHGSAWLPTMEKLDLEGRVIGNSNKAKRQALSDFELGFPGIYLVTPQLFSRSDVSAWSGDLAILDEVHALMSPKGQGQRRTGGYSPRDNPISTRFDGRMALSGTPLRNRFQLSWGLSRFLYPSLNKRGQIAHDQFFIWEADRMNYQTVYTSKRDQFGRPVTVKQYHGEKIPGKWISELPCVITHKKREACCEFHPNGFMDLDEPTVIEETITLAPAQKKAIREMESMLVTYLDENPMIAEIPLTKAQRIRQLTLGVPTLIPADDSFEVMFDTECVSPYFDRLVDILQNDIEDETAVVYTSSQKFAAVVTERLNRLGIPAFEFSGATRKDRDQKAKEFGTRYRVMVGVLAAVAEGYDGLQHLTNNEIWLDRSTDETLNEQAMGRTDRMGQTKQVMRWIFHDDLGLSEGRYSEQVTKRLQLNKSLRIA